MVLLTLSSLQYLNGLFCHRYMMYVRKEGEVYMLDRDNAVFSVPSIRFPSRKSPDQHLNETLIDGVSSKYFLALSLTLAFHRRWSLIAFLVMEFNHGI